MKPTHRDLVTGELVYFQCKSCSGRAQRAWYTDGRFRDLWAWNIKKHYEASNG